MKLSFLSIALVATTSLAGSGDATSSFSGEPGTAPAYLSSGVYTPGGRSLFQDTQFFWGGRNFCWYPLGWHGPGYYWCGYADRRGYGWGGPAGWHGWGRGGRYHGGYGGYGHGGYHGGYGHGGGFGGGRGGFGHGGGHFSGGGHGNMGGHGGGGGFHGGGGHGGGGHHG